MTNTLKLPKVHRPVSVFDRPREKNKFLTNSQQQNQQSCAPLAIVPGGGLCQEGSEVITELSETVQRDYHDYLYLCHTELRDMKQSITQPFHEIERGNLDELVQIITELFEGVNTITYGETVSDIRRKAASLGMTAIGQSRTRQKLHSNNASAAAATARSKISFKPKPKDLKFLNESNMIKPENPQTNPTAKPYYSASDTDSETNNHDNTAAKVSLVKARWLNNYKKYNRLKKNREAKKLQIGKYGDVGDAQPPLSGNVFTISPQSRSKA